MDFREFVKEVEQERRPWLFMLSVEKAKGKGPGYHAPHFGRPGKRGGSRPRSAGGALGESLVAEAMVLDKRVKGRNKSVLLTFEDGSKAIFKPETDRRNLKRIEAETLAYELSESLGWGIVPETVKYEHEGAAGSLQSWVPNSKSWAQIYRETDEDPGEAAVGDRRAMLDVLDAVTGHLDRHYGNIVEDSKGRVWAIDNDTTFDHKTTLKTELMLEDIEAAPKLIAARKRAALKLVEWSRTKRRAEYQSNLISRMRKFRGKYFDANIALLEEWVKP